MIKYRILVVLFWSAYYLKELTFKIYIASTYFTPKFEFKKFHKEMMDELKYIWNFKD